MFDAVPNKAANIDRSVDFFAKDDADDADKMAAIKIAVFANHASLTAADLFVT